MNFSEQIILSGLVPELTIIKIFYQQINTKPRRSK